MPWHDPKSLGMNPKAGLVEPDLPMPKATEELWLVHPYDGDGKPRVGHGAAPHVHDQNKLIAKKFKAVPSTQAELRDCQATLSVEELQNISCGPKTIDFGRVSVRAVNKRCFSVANYHSHTILVALKVPEGCKELMGSGPTAQVIPSGGVAGFDIQLTSDEVQDFAERVEYVINGNHTFVFNVEAEVRPIVCEVRPAALRFEFPDDSIDVEMSKTVTIANLSDAVAEYKWSVDSTAATSYAIQPSSGRIAPNGTATATVTFRATAKPTDDSVLRLIVAGGDELTAPPSLTCSAVIEEPKLQFAAKKV